MAAMPAAETRWADPPGTRLGAGDQATPAASCKLPPLEIANALESTRLKLPSMVRAPGVDPTLYASPVKPYAEPPTTPTHEIPSIISGSSIVSVMPAPLGSPLVLPAPAPRSAPNPLSLHIPDAPTLRIAKKSVSFAPDSEIEKVKIISPLASPNMMGPDSPAGDPFGGSDYAGYDYPLGGLAPMDPRAELLGTSVSYTGFGYDSYDPHAAPAYMNGFQYAAEVEHVSSISHDVAPYDAAASPTTLGYTRQVTEQTSPQYTGFGFTPSDMEPETVSLVPDESLALAHAATELQGRWEFSGFDTGAMELWTEGEGLGGALSGKRSGDVTGRAYMGSVFKGATRKEDLCVKLLLDEQQSSFRGWYYQKAEPAAGGVWDGKLAPDVPLVRPFVGLWQVDDESEGVQVGLKLAPDPSGMVGELIIPDDEEDADEDDGGGGGGVRLMGKTPELAPVGKLRLDGGEEVLLFLDKQPFQKDRLHVWVATHDDCAMGDLFTATKRETAQHDMDFIP